MPNNLTTTGLGIAGAEVITVDRPSEEEYSPNVAGVLQAIVHELICRVEEALKLMTVNPTNASRDISSR